MFDIGDAGSEWRKIEQTSCTTCYWTKDDPVNFKIVNINIELYRATNEPISGLILAFIDEFNLKV